MWWSEGTTVVVFRSAIFVGLASVVTTIIYFTPIPGQDFVSCERPCHELEMPMICRLKLTLESFQTRSRECSGCPQKHIDCFGKHCITADGFRRNIRTANRQLPGPTINVCENDILVVDVVNRLPGQEVTLHWRGQPVKETPFMDGAAMVTQCPIPSSTTFQYKFRASRPGTHMWHAHTDQENNGIFGALVVRQAASQDVDSHLYDVDDVSHVIIVNTFTHRDAGHDALLINGRSQAKTEAGEFPASIFTVTPSKRHRFRLVNAGGGKGVNCPISVSVESHVMQVIALDGSPIVPKDTSSISLMSGERADFVLHATRRNSTYLLRASSTPSCGMSPPLQAFAVVRYDADHDSEATSTEADDASVHLSSVTTGTCGKQDERACVMDLMARESMPEELRWDKLDVVLYLAFGYKKFVLNDTSRSSEWYDLETVPYMNNVSFVYPSSPLLTQPDSVNFDSVCNQDSIPPRCENTNVCECVHVIDIPLDTTVELVLVDEGGSEDDHTFHLHGNSYHVVGVAQLPAHVTSSQAKQLDERGKLLSRNLNNPVVKDTLTVPKRGIAALRFKADNPGYWLLDNDRSPSFNVILHVGQPGDTHPTPESFPRCGSWVGPDFFLI